MARLNITKALEFSTIGYHMSTTWVVYTDNTKATELFRADNNEDFLKSISFALINPDGTDYNINNGIYATVQFHYSDGFNTPEFEINECK